MHMPSVAVVGDNTIDRYADAGLAFVGGNALNVTIRLASRGIRTAYYGAIGDDIFGQAIRSALMEHGVDVQGLAVLPGGTAITDIELRPDGDRVFVREDFGVTAVYAPDARALERIAGADWVHVGMLPEASSFRRALRDAGFSGTISQDCSVAEGMDALDVAFVSADHSSISAAEAGEYLSAGRLRLIVVTEGERGAIAYSPAGVRRQGVYAVDAVDTTGAGDGFIAGFIAEAMHGADLAAALDSAAREGAAACTHTGSWPQTPIRLSASADSATREAGS